MSIIIAQSKGLDGASFGSREPRGLCLLYFSPHNINHVSVPFLPFACLAAFVLACARVL